MTLKKYKQHAHDFLKLLNFHRLTTNAFRDLLDDISTN